MGKKDYFKIKKSYNIGSPDAETDEMLLDAFIQTEDLHQIVDIKSQKSILIGRTGSGKSAIIKYIQNNCQNCIQISPESMSLKFLSNSTILKHFKQIHINLNFFYKVLWKHVFIVELLKLYFADEKKAANSNKLFFKNIIQNIKSKTLNRNPKREKAIEYLENWTDDFWKETEYRIKSFEDKIKENYQSSMGINLDAIKAKIGGAEDSEKTFLYEAKSKAENVIQKSQSEDLIEIIDIMKDELFNNYQKKFFIIIDDLDKEWVEDEFRYELIGAMIEVVKEFRQFQGVKIVIALRENLSEIIFTGLRNKGGQREKFKPLFANLTCSDKDLYNLIDKRLKLLSNNQLDVQNAFSKIRRDNKTGFDYVIERSYKRPRDIISYINLAIEESNNRTSFTRDIIFKVETRYSLYRFQALEDEWSENYGNFKLTTLFLQGIQNGFRLKSINENSFEEIYFCDDPINTFNGELLQAISEWQADSIKYTVFLKKLILILFRIGILGIKKGPNYPPVFYYDYDVIIDKNDISNNSRFYVHPSLFSYFKINVMAQLPEDSEGEESSTTNT